MSETHCSHCGKEIQEGARICPHCGATQPRPLPLALIAAFFVIGVLVGLLYVNSDSFDRLRSNMQSWVISSGEGTDSEPSEVAPDTKPDVRPAPPQTEPLACNREGALAIRKKAREIAEITEQSGELHVQLREQWAYYSQGIRRSFLQAFVESDSCLQGYSRPIQFYYRGKTIAVSEPPEGLRLLP